MINEQIFSPKSNMNVFTHIIDVVDVVNYDDTT